MKITRYRYEKDMAEAKRKIMRLEEYRAACMRIFDGISDTDGDAISKKWLMKNFRFLVSMY